MKSDTWQIAPERFEKLEPSATCLACTKQSPEPRQQNGVQTSSSYCIPWDGRLAADLTHERLLREVHAQGIVLFLDGLQRLGEGREMITASRLWLAWIAVVVLSVPKAARLPHEPQPAAQAPRAGRSTACTAQRRPGRELIIASS